MKQQLLNYINHRNAPIPSGPWIMYQRWENIMCMHIPVSKERISPHIPEPLELDIYEDQAWISIFTFRVSGMQQRGMPKFPWFNSFPEVNVRTYVRHDGIPGVYFFSLDAAKIIPVIGARLVSLPYFKAKMKMAEGMGWTHYSSRRQYGSGTFFKGRYKSISSPSATGPDSLDYWLFERYYLFNTVKGRIVHIGIHHLPWKPADVSVVYDRNGVNSLLPGDIEGTPAISHYVDSLDVIFWPLQKT